MIRRHKALIPHGVAVGITAQWAPVTNLAGGIQAGAVCLWYTIMQHAAMRVRTFEIYGTGENIPDNREFIATVQDGNFVWHIFEVVRP